MFKLKWKTNNELRIWILMFSYFENQKAIEFCFLFHLLYRNKNKLCFKFCSSICQKKKIWNGTLGTLSLGWYNTCIIYLYVTETCLKVTTVMFYFWRSKNISNITKNIFSSMSICCWKKLLVNKYKKQMCYNENLYFFEVMKNGEIFSLKVCHFQYDHRFLFRRETRNSRTCKEVCMQKLIKSRLSG